MAFMTVKLVPGVRVEQTPLLLQAGVIQSNNVRWKDGLPEKIGGWQKFYFGASPPVATASATAAFITGSAGIAMAPNPGTVKPGMTVTDVTLGQVLGTVQSYGPLLVGGIVVPGFWSVGATTLDMGRPNTFGIIPGMSIQDQNYGDQQIGSVVSWIGHILTTTPLTVQTQSHAGDDVFVFSSGPGPYPPPPTNHVLVLDAPLAANSAGAADVLRFDLPGQPSGNVTPPPLAGPIRELWTWADLDGINHLAAAGESNVFVITGGVVQPVTPQFLIRNPSTMATTSTRSDVVITDVGSTATIYESVTLETPYSIGGVCHLSRQLSNRRRRRHRPLYDQNQHKRCCCHHRHHRLALHHHQRGRVILVRRPSSELNRRSATSSGGWIELLDRPAHRGGRRCA